MTHPVNLLRTALATTALAAMSPAAAAAAPPWSAPAPLTHGSADALQGQPSLTANAAGLAVAVADSGGGTVGPRSRASVFTDGAFGAPSDLAAQDVAYGPGSGQVRAYARTRLLAAGLDDASGTPRALFAFGRLAPNRASLDPPRPLGPAGLRAGPASLAVDAAGDAAMVYPVCRDAGCAHVLVYLAVRRAGSSTISSTRLADGSGPLPQVTVAVDARGDALAVWTQASTLYARIRTAGGTLRARQTVGAVARGNALAPSAALSTHRGELVGWTSQHVGEGEAFAGRAAVAQARDGGSFSGVTLSSLPVTGAGRYVSGAGVRVAFDPLGRRLLAWTAYDGDPDTGRFTVHAAQLHGAASRPGPTLVDPQVVCDPAVDTVLEDMATSADGAQLLTLEAGARGHDAPSGTTTIQAASRARGATGPFTREDVSSGGDLAFGATAALLPDRAVAVWTTPAQTALAAERIGPAASPAARSGERR